MTGDFHVDLVALEQAADGVKGALEQLGDRSVQDIGGAVADFGHDRLASILGDFCDRWQAGVSNLAKDCQEIASRLTDSVTTYRNIDEHSAGLFQPGGQPGG
jgi:hypothetical protein